MCGARTSTPRRTAPPSPSSLPPVLCLLACACAPPAPLAQRGGGARSAFISNDTIDCKKLESDTNKIEEKATAREMALSNLRLFFPKDPSVRLPQPRILVTLNS